MKNLIVSNLLLSTTIISKPLYSQRYPEDQYRRMDSVEGHTELCFGTNDLENILF